MTLAVASEGSIYRWHVDAATKLTNSNQASKRQNYFDDLFVGRVVSLYCIPEAYEDKRKPMCSVLSQVGVLLKWPLLFLVDSCSRLIEPGWHIVDKVEGSPLF